MPSNPYNLRGQGAAGGDHEAEASDGGSEGQPAVDVPALMAAITRIQEKMDEESAAAKARADAAEARFAALEASAGGEGSDGGWDVREETCSFEGCSRPRFKDGGRVHAYCGRTHAQAAGALEDSGDAAGVDPDRQVAVQPTPTFYDTGGGTQGAANAAPRQ